MLDGTISPEETKYHYLGIVSQETGRLARLGAEHAGHHQAGSGRGASIHAQTYDLRETVDVVLDEQRIEDGNDIIQGLLRPAADLR